MIKSPKQSPQEHKEYIKRTKQPLFIIPNPFDDYVRDKNGWFKDLKKLDKEILLIKQKLQALSSKQVIALNNINEVRNFCLAAGKNNLSK